MKDNERKHRISKAISIVALIICLVGIIIASMNLRYTIVNNYDTGPAITSLLCMISISFANLAIFLISSRKYKNSSK